MKRIADLILIAAVLTAIFCFWMLTLVVLGEKNLLPLAVGAGAVCVFLAAVMEKMTD